ncbi:MAG: hypothetical protein MUF47_07745 [Porphyrobacter sp.]|jgi:hypothetical protein|nr:hypothetical protein [Porphyrobacter sp.]
MTAEKRTKLYLTQAHVGALATLGVVGAFAIGLPDFVKGLAIGLMVVPLGVMLIRRFRDEYIETLWNAGTSLAFAVLVVGYLMLPFLEGFYDGFTGRPVEQDIPAHIAGFAAIAAFYVGFHVSWLRGLK